MKATMAGLVIATIASTAGCASDDFASTTQGVQPGGSANTSELLLLAHRSGDDAAWGASEPFTFFESDPGQRCYEHRVGPCLVFDCRSEMYMHDPLVDVVSLGPVRFTSAESSVVWSLGAPYGLGVYSSVTQTGPGWNPGDVIEFSAPGDDLPGFDLSLRLDAAANATQPDLENIADDSFAIDHTVPLPVAWEPTSDTIAFEIYQYRGAPMGGHGVHGAKWPWDGLNALCFFDGAAGAGTIPLGVTQLLNPHPMFAGGSGIGINHAVCAQRDLAGRTLNACTTNYTYRSATIQ